VALLSDVASALLAPGRLAGAVLPSPGKLREVLGQGRVEGRRACVRDDRAIIEVRGGRRPDAAGFGDRLARALEEMPGVTWARLNAPLEHVFVGLKADEPPPLSALVSVISQLEHEYLSRPEPEGPPVTGQDGADGSPVDGAAVERAALALAANSAGLVMSAAGAGLRLLRLPAELASAATVIDSQPRLRGALEAAAGRPATDLGLAVVSALTQGLARSRAGLTVDLLHRAGRLSEVLAARGAWCARESELLAGPDRAAAGPVVTERPAPLPPGPVETYADQAGLFGIGTFGLTVAATGGPRRAVDLSLATVPKAARIGREGFAGGLGRVLARRGAVVLDAAALRRLDRVNTVVLDAQVLVTGQLMLGEVVNLADAPPELVAGHLHELFRATDPTAVRACGGWVLGPVEQLRLRGRHGVRDQQRLLRDGATAVLGLAVGERLMAVAAVTAEQAGSVDTLAAACHHAGVRLIVAGPPQAMWTSLADAVVPGSDRLLGSVRRMQANGAVVLLLSGRGDALAGADVGIGVDGPGRMPPWGADVLAGHDLETAALVIESCGVAARVSRQAVAFSQAGSVLGGAAALAGSGRGGGPGTARSAMLGVNASAGLAFAQGSWAALQVGRTPLAPPISRVPWHAMPADAVLVQLTATAGGLTRVEAGRRRPTSRPDLDTPSLVRAVMHELDNPLTPILAGGAALSAAVGSAVDAGLVAGVSALSAVLGGVQRLRTDRAVASLMAGSAVAARVLRDGTEVTLPAEQLVPGDVIEVRSGDVVPADCRVLEAAGLQADESAVTGEAFPVTKQAAAVVASTVAERASMLYEGTSVAAGRGRAVVVAIGESTEAGRSMAAARGAAPPTGVESRLAAITGTTLPVALGSAAAVVAAGLLRGRPLRDGLSAGVSLAVASVPEGLPFLVSAAQLASARRLSGHGALVRNPGTIEALGRVDTLCFDKTGTLTEGRITLAAVADTVATVALNELGDEQRRTLAAGLRATPRPRGGQPLAHLTDRAVTEGAETAGLTREHELPGWRRLAVLPFEPSRGFHATLGGAGEAVVLSVKGAPETVFPRCAKVRADGKEIPLGPASRTRVRRRAEQLAGQGYRVLAVAERPDRPRRQLTSEEVTGLTLLGFLALSDPVRPAASASITALRQSGVQIVMITGDHPATARAIAERLDVLNGGRVITGPQLDALDDSQLDALLPQVSVVARGTPAHKVRVVRAFQRLHRTVAMTGDGANDAPAIRLAEVGIALGRRSTPAARAAADLVVTDDRLETIIAALVEGRGMWASVREALGILVGGNLGEIGFTVLGSALTGQSPLSARQLLLVNMLTDLAPAMAIALRPPGGAATSALLAEGPEASLGAALTYDITQRAVTTAGAATAAWTAARLTGRTRRARTVALAALVGSQLGQTLATGGPSPAVIASTVGSAAALVAVIQTPGVSQFFECTPLGPVGWGIAGTAAAAATAGGPLTARLVRPLSAALDGRLSEISVQPDWDGGHGRRRGCPQTGRSVNGESAAPG
jgi:calcium-translocating P-type ATPase